MRSRALLLSPAQARALEKRLKGMSLTPEEMLRVNSVRTQLAAIVESLAEERLER